jgi:tRNA U34 2-thiouridine synthase MnmA/TrmU
MEGVQDYRDILRRANDVAEQTHDNHRVDVLATGHYLKQSENNMGDTIQQKKCTGFPCNK